MKSLYYVILIAIVGIVSGCSSNKSITGKEFINNTIWANFTPAELNNEKGTIINSIFFTNDDHYIMKTGIGQDSTVLVSPVFTEYGTYTCSGSIKKGIKISMSPETSVIGKEKNMEGLITEAGMIIITPQDNSESIYFKLDTKK